MSIAVDSNIFLALLNDGPLAQTSLQARQRCADDSPLIICETVHAEVSAAYPTRLELETDRLSTHVRLLSTTADPAP